MTAKAPQISWVYDPAAARWLLHKSFTPLIWPQLPVPHIQWKQLNKMIKTDAECNHCCLCDACLSVKCLTPSIATQTQSRDRKLKPTALETLWFFLVQFSFMKEKICRIPQRVALYGHLQQLLKLKHRAVGLNQSVYVLRCYEAHIRGPCKAKPSPDFTSGNRISWGFNVPEGNGYLSDSPLWRPGCHCYTWSVWAWLEFGSGSYLQKEVCRVFF